MYKFKMEGKYYITAEVLEDASIKALKDDYIEVTLYDDRAKRHTYIFKLKADKDGRKCFTCFNRDFYI